MRGKQVRIADHIGKERITPADAGKTGRLSMTINGVKDHPRGCGENIVDI